MKKEYNLFKSRAEFIYESTTEYAKAKQQLYIKNSEYTELTSMKLKMTHQRKKKILKIRKKMKRSCVTNVKRQTIS